MAKHLVGVEDQPTVTTLATGRVVIEPRRLTEDPAALRTRREPIEVVTLGAHV
ncbi:hypothetical protein NJ7G_1765 [Natrinema sp. J7-2]|nr:hypothetical protein NJ7G_1765 [Natrinema sp. J7-2]